MTSKLSQNVYDENITALIHVHRICTYLKTKNYLSDSITWSLYELHISSGIEALHAQTVGVFPYVITLAKTDDVKSCV